MATPRKRARGRKPLKAKAKKTRKLKKRKKGGSGAGKSRRAPLQYSFDLPGAPDILEAFEGDRPTTTRPPGERRP
jgi:hypothetical protein